MGAVIVRLVGALMLEQHDEWAVSRRYMTLETLAETGDAELISPPAVPARSLPGPNRGPALTRYASGHDRVRPLNEPPRYLGAAA